MFQQSFLQTSTAAAGLRRRSTFFAIWLQMSLVIALIVVPRMFIQSLPINTPLPVLPTNVVIRSMPMQPASSDTVQTSRSSSAVPTFILSIKPGNPIITGNRGNDGSTDGSSNNIGPNLGNCVGASCLPAMNFRPSEIHLQPTPAPAIFRPSHLDPGMLIHRVEPVYPHIAIIAHQEGEVVLQAIIATDGSISQLHAVLGPVMLRQAALEAVEQWRYKPYVLNGQVVPVETEIHVKFTLQK